MDDATNLERTVSGTFWNIIRIRRVRSVKFTEKPKNLHFFEGYHSGFPPFPLGMAGNFDEYVSHIFEV